MAISPKHALEQNFHDRFNDACKHIDAVLRIRCDKPQVIEIILDPNMSIDIELAVKKAYEDAGWTVSIYWKSDNLGTQNKCLTLIPIGFGQP